MNPNDLGMFGPLLAGFQQRAKQMREEAANKQVVGKAAGGLVVVTMTCDYNIIGVEISPDAMDDREMLEDLVRAASADALQKVHEHVSGNLKSLTGGLPIPPGLIPGL